MISLYFLGAWSIWLLLSVAVGKIVRRVTGRRRAGWVTTALMFMAPFGDLPIGILLTKHLINEFGGHTRVERRVEADGFLWLGYTSLWSPPWYVLTQSRPYGYLEMKYPQTYTVLGAQPSSFRPGFYQFRLLSAGGKDKCFRPIEDLPPDSYRLWDANWCFSVTRTDAPVSRYAYHNIGKRRLGPIYQFFNIGVMCLSVEDLLEHREIASECRYVWDSWLPPYLGPVWQWPYPGSEESGRSLHLHDVVVPPARNDQQYDSEPR